MDQFMRKSGKKKAGSYCMLLLLLSFISMRQMFAQTSSLDQPVTLSLSNVSLSAVIAALDEQSDFIFSYDKAVMDSVHISKVNWKAVPLKKVLSELTQTTGLTYQANANTIALKLGKRPQPGSIRGRIVDFETAEPLPGASVMLSGTRVGAITDNRGFYEIKNVPVGSYTLVAGFTGYQEGILWNVTVEPNVQAVYDVKMQTGGSLKEVIVESGHHKLKAVTHNTEKQLLGEIKDANGVVSGISNELINRTGDRNAAEVAKRIPGVTVVDDRFIVVRGMNERYTLTYLNNNIAPSTELYNKSFAYDLLPSSVIDKILVYKSPVANLVADYGGAAIKVFTKKPAAVRHFDIGLQLAHRPNSTLTTVNSYNGGKYDVLGFDDGTRKLPSFSPGILQSNKQVSNTVAPAQFIKGFSPTLDYSTRHSSPDLQGFFNFYYTWKFGHKRLYNLTSMTYTKETICRDVRKQLGNTYAQNAQDDDTTAYTQADADYNRFIRSQQTFENAKVNVLENITLKLNERNTINFNNFFVNDGRRFTSITTTTANVSPGTDSNLLRKKDIVLSFEQRLLYSGNLGGEHMLDALKKHQLTWNLGYTYDLQKVPDQRISHFISNQNYADDSWIAAGSNASGFDTRHYGFQGMITRMFIKNEEQLFNGAVDYTFHVQPAFDLKIGSCNFYKTRSLGRRLFRVNRAGLDNGLWPHAPNDDLGWYNGYGYNDPSLLRFRAQDLSSVWSNKYFPDDQSGLAVYDVTSPVDAYVASERYNAFYAMGDWKLAHQKIVVNAGLRAEIDRQRLSGAQDDGAHNLVPVVLDHLKVSWLPSINIAYHPDSAYVIRAGYGRTVNRPDFRELTPYNDFDYQNNQLIIGNPSVQTATIDNLDLRLELYPQHGNLNEVLNLGVFYKYLDKPIERVFYDVKGAAYSDGFPFPIISYSNSVSARLYGIEAEIKKSLSFVPGKLFRNLSVVINGAWIKSSTITHKFNQFYAVDSTQQKGEGLQGQSPYTLNGGLFYENTSWGTKLGLVYNVSGPRIYAKSVRTREDHGAASTFTRPNLLQLPMHLLDFSITQHIAKTLQMKFSIQNLLDQSYRIAEDQNFNSRYDKEVPMHNAGSGVTYYKGDDIYTSYKPGRYFLLQFTYAF
ncbi:TonB-dependent receptor [Deminuibacter soli]|uniref:TonB-dependent receptor n=1 Tax=Deminuibacter soli TaxID=2291815 RepID=A0A3E1NG63_9BACT|nr:TonB-dependent receptor [Deminuibacter soli]RFM26862.1 TonB-dependent receptor [Deminuibacter soli]